MEKVFANSLNAITLLKDGCSTTNPQQTLTENIHQIHNNTDEVNYCLQYQVYKIYYFVM
jgi:hypothetical protein